MVTSRSLFDVDRSTHAVSLRAYVRKKRFGIHRVFAEIARGAKSLVRMEGNQTILDPPEGSHADKRATERKLMTFTFDKSYWSAGARDEPGYCSQQMLYDDLGKELLDHGFAGFNACILACGYHVPRTKSRIADFMLQMARLVSIQDMEAIAAHADCAWRFRKVV